MDATQTYDELAAENDALHKRISELEIRLTSDIVARSREERRISEVAKQTVRRDFQARFGQHWRMALADAKRSLDGLIHRAETLPDKPKADRVAALRAAAVEAKAALDEAAREAGAVGPE